MTLGYGFAGKLKISARHRLTLAVDLCVRREAPPMPKGDVIWQASIARSTGVRQRATARPGAILAGAQNLNEIDDPAADISIFYLDESLVELQALGRAYQVHDQFAVLVLGKTGRGDA
jgi:hypothetical protein